MTQEERQMLTDLANKIGQTPAPARDAEADEFIRTRIGSRPDALYIMTQTVMIQNLALDHARQQIQELQQRAAAPAGGSSLLGSGRPAPAAPPAPPPPAYEPQQPSGASSFLRSAATTAAGVAAGALAFEGIRSLFGGGGFGGFGGFGGGGMMHGGGFLSDAPVSETIVNNYYEAPEQKAADDTGSDAADSDDDSSDDSDDSGDSGDTSSGDDFA